MIDCSRNAVMSAAGLKNFLPYLAKMGYNCVMLYTEDTYEVDGEPYFGYMRGRYTKEELREIDDFCASLGMELIPCIQTLAHLNAFVRWGKVPVDHGDILLTDNERTYELIDRMLASTADCIRSRRIHIGMDEAEMLGRGKHLDEHGYETVGDIMRRHLARVMEIAKKYGYEPMIWSDMYFKPWNGGVYNAPKTEIPKEYVDAFPKDLIPVYWDYYNFDTKVYEGMLENHKQLSDRTWFAGGAWSWRGFAPFNDFTLQTMRPALDACLRTKTKSVLITMWMNHGAECSLLSLLPSLCYLAEYAKGERDEAKIKARFKRIVGMDYDEFIKVDLTNMICGNEQSSITRSPSKIMLYSDPFNGFLDYTVRKGGGQIFARHAEELHAIRKKTRRFGYIFETLARLSEVMTYKYELGVKTREAYQAGDREELRRLANEDYVKARKLIDPFAKAFERQWFRENKTCGFDVQDIRLGAVERRLDSCRRRLLDYCDGKIDRIEELECEVLPFNERVPKGYSVNYNVTWTDIITANAWV